MSAAQEFDADSVAAIIVAPGGRYLLQHREARDGIDFPGMWGLFGGSYESNETAEDALRRELCEELGLTVSSANPFATLVFDERPYGGWYCRRTYFELPVTEEALRALDLREGDAMTLMSLSEAASLGRLLIPFDACALLMHDRREVSKATRPRTADAGKDGVR
jgi:8-oxo-dGTP pyrophosphatase MutT (NUDIX family)